MYVLNTCVQLVEQNESLKRQIIEQANSFAKNPANRTADIVPSIQVLIAQVIACLELPEASQIIKNSDPQSDQGDLKLEIDVKKFCQSAVEEVMRRMQKKDAQPLSKANLLVLLHGDVANLLEKVKHQRKSEIKEQKAKVALNGEDPYAQFRVLADELR